MESSRDDFVIAIRSAFLKKGNQQKFSLLSLILFSIIFLILGSYNFKIINFNKIIIKEIIYYSSFIVNVPENIIKNSSNKVTAHFELYDNYIIAESELQELKNKDLEKKIITFENVELRKLIEDYFIEDNQAYAKVLIDKKSPFLRSIVINKGSKNGVKVGMAVFDDIYLVGKIVNVNYLSSRVLLISDINSKVPVTILPLNIEGIMSGLDERRGQLQYISEKGLISNNAEELIVVTSGLGGLFKSGIPIGKINSVANSSDDDEDNSLVNQKLEVNFYRNFSQLKYVKILSYKKDNINLDLSDKKTIKKNNGIISELNNQAADIEILQQQKIINNEIRIKIELENNELKKNLINVKKIIEEKNKKIEDNKSKNENLKFLELNLIHGHKCRRNLFKPNLFKVNTEKYKTCVLNHGIIKKN